MDEDTRRFTEVGPVPWSANEEDTLTDMPVVPPRSAGHRRRRERKPWGLYVVLPLLAGGLSGLALWLVPRDTPEKASPAVTVTPAARPGPTVTVRVPGPVRVVTRTHTTTARATVTRRVPGPTVTVTQTPQETLTPRD